MSSLSNLLPVGMNPIHVWSGMRIELLWIYDGEIHPLNRHRQSDHSRGYWVWFLQQGHVEVSQGSTRLRAEAGECMISPRGVVEQDFADDTRILSVHFGCEWPTGDSLFASNEGCVFKTADFPGLIGKALELSRFVKSGFPQEPDDVHFSQQSVPYGHFLQLQRHFIEWLELFSETLVKLGYVFSQVGTIDGRLLNAIRCLEQTSLDAEFPAALIQRESGLGRSQLDRLFFQTFRLSTRSYWNRRKLESAKALLASTTNPVKELGFRLGFKQPSHFTTWFQSHTALTPIAFRNRESHQPPAERPAKSRGRKPSANPS
ncbi:MAG TPA: helix-turn-helix domain-containing protein [Rariglobus sp.]